MFHELRLYKSAPGRLHEIAARMADIYPPVFARTGFHPPLGEWTCTAGPDMPLYVWLVRWDSYEHREQTFARLYADPDWGPLRKLTNGPSEMVLGYDLYLLERGLDAAATAALHPGRTGTVEGVHELRLYHIFPGRAQLAMRSLAEVHLPALRDAGGVTLGVFKVSIGAGLPAIVHLTAWPDHAARDRGLELHAADPRVKAQLASERSQLMTEVLGRYESWLMRPTLHRPPRFNLDEREAPGWA